MKRNVLRTLGVLALCGAILPALAAEEGDWKRGRLYYRSVCTACHKAEHGKSISPLDKTIAEWKAYVAADKHDASGKSKSSLAYFTSRAYRDSIKADNRVAEKFIDVPDAELMADVLAWVVHGAKDSDTPARCQ